MKKHWALEDFCFFSFFHGMFQNIKHILTLDSENPSEFKKQFSNEGVGVQFCYITDERKIGRWIGCSVASTVLVRYGEERAERRGS